MLKNTILYCLFYIVISSYCTVIANVTNILCDYNIDIIFCQFYGTYVGSHDYFSKIMR